MVEAVESRVLFALDAVGQAFNPGQAQLVFTDIINSSAGGNSATPVQTATLRNTGTGTIAITSIALADDPGLSGEHADQFEITNLPTIPTSIAPGGTLTLDVRFRATSVGLKAALLRVQSSDPANLDVALRGIGTTSESNGDVGGDHEPSLQRILRAFQIPVNVGDTNGEDTFDLPTPRPAGTVHDEVEMQRLRKAGGGPVIIEPLAEYAFNTKTGPIGHFGFYTPGTKDAKTELFAVNVGERTSTNPSWGATFDPGSADFALYGDFNGTLFEINGLPRGVYSEDSFNTWDANNKKKVRYFPLKNKDGSVVPNAFVFAFEEFQSGYDSNDLIGIIRNVTAAPTGAEIGTENLDRGLASPTRLVFNRIQQQPPTTVVEDEEVVLPNNIVHDKAKVRVHNSGSSTLNISSVVLSNTTDFQLNTGGLNGSTIAPGAFKDIEVQFIATSGGLESGTLTINTNDADEPALVVQLAGFWQNRSEHNEEPDLFEIANQLFGYKTVFTNSGELLNPPGQSGKVQKVGEEVLSPYWRRADAARAVEVIQINAFHTHNEEATFRWHPRGSNTTTNLFTHEALDAQSILPHLKGNPSAIAAAVFKPPAQGGDTNPAFGFRVDNEWSDPTKNVQEQAGGGFGHHLRFWPLKDAAGKVVPDTYILGMDYRGINYDYQDNIYLIRNIRPADAPAGGVAAPAGLAATGSTSGVALNWNDNAEPTLAGYNVYRGASSGFVPSASNKINATLLTTSEFNDATAPAGATSFYKVTAVDNAGTESPTTSASATRPPEEPGTPNAPTGLIATAVSQTSINLSWTSSAGATNYVVERRDGASATFAVISSSVTTTSFADAGLSPNTAYEYRVSAANGAGQSSPSGTASATTLAVDEPPVNEPPPPAATISSVTVDEPAALQTVNATFTVTLSAADDQPITLNFATADISAQAGGDYTAASGTITFAPGETSKQINVVVLGDGLADEQNETFALNLSVASGTVTLADAQAIGTIAGDLGPPPPTPVPFGGRTFATFTGTDGKPVRISLKGPGSGEMIQENGGVTITAAGTTAASSLTISGGAATIRGVNVNGSLRSLSGKKADLAGGVVVTGSLGKLLLANASGGHVISVGPGGTLSVTLATASDLSVVSTSPIKSFKAAAWLDSAAGPQSLTAPSVSSLTVKGDLTADLFVGELGRLNVSGAISGADVRSGGNVGSVRAASMTNSKLFAGVANEVDVMPDASSDFATPARIGSVSLRNRTGGPTFSNSVIAATDLGRISVGDVATSNNGTRFGIVGDNLASATGTLPTAGKFSHRGLTGAADVREEADFLLRVL